MKARQRQGIRVIIQKKIVFGSRDPSIDLQEQPASIGAIWQELRDQVGT